MSEAKAKVLETINAVLSEKEVSVSEEAPLLGDGSALDSMTLVELCIALEDVAAEMGFEFDWTSDAAMSKSRSMFRTAGSLAAEFQAQMESQT